ncbi:hypothetical protein E2C01_055404 [Portunus trituberculatus]|uniref:Uncharacterized protein n=1 Tax=Portunus trituberculatus TaxID=210409 RepID=A0A5B7GXM7_PORTR|nr:hypothetical protein [Portunus trituberculatus]
METQNNSASMQGINKMITTASASNLMTHPDADTEQENEHDDEERATSDVEETLEFSPQNSPRVVGDRYVRLWNAAFGERTESGQREERRREYASRKVHTKIPSSLAALDQPVEISARCVLLWNEVFREPTESKQREYREEKREEQQRKRLIKPRRLGSFERLCITVFGEVMDIEKCDQAVEVAARCVRLWNEVFGEFADSRQREEEQERRRERLIRLKRVGSFERLCIAVFGEATEDDCI